MTEEFQKLMASGYTTAQMTQDALETVNRIGARMSETYSLDEMLEWVVGNTWRSAYWERFDPEFGDIYDTTSFTQILSPEQVSMLREAAGKFFVDSEQYESVAARVVHTLLD